MILVITFFSTFFSSLCKKLQRWPYWQYPFFKKLKQVLVLYEVLMVSLQRSSSGPWANWHRFPQGQQPVVTKFLQREDLSFDLPSSDCIILAGFSLAWVAQNQSVSVSGSDFTGDAWVQIVALIIRKKRSMKQVYDYNAQISFVKEFKKGGIRVCYPFLFHKDKMGWIILCWLMKEAGGIRIARHQKSQL